MRLLLIDNQPLIAQGLASLLEDYGCCEFRHARTAESGEVLFEEFCPELTIVDVKLPDGSGLELLGRLLRIRRDARLAVLTLDEEPLTALRALEAGARGFIGKTDSPDQILEAIDFLRTGGSWLPKRFIQDVARLRSRDEGHVNGITDRDCKMLEGLAYGETLHELAYTLGRSYKTVAKDCANLRARLGAKSVAEMVRIALEKKLIT